MIDLFSIASSGVNASNKLLETTSNNIANVNTDGFVREKTVFNNHLTTGVGKGTTERVVNTFAQNQLRRDITSVNELEAFKQKAGAIDNLLASEAIAISTGMSQFFAAMQTAADDPTNLASREAVLGEARALVNRLDNTSGYLQNKEDELNLEFADQVRQANEIIKNIGELNRSILTVHNGSNQSPNGLMNERDKAINQLAEIMSVEVRDNANGTKSVNLSSGESLVMEGGTFNLFELATGADPGQKKLELVHQIADRTTEIPITEDRLGGSLGGLFKFRNEILSPAQRDIGQIGIAMADAVNAQNRLGMDMDMQLGGDIFTLPTIRGLNFNNSDNTLTMSGEFVPGQGKQVTDADIKITITSVDGSGAPLTFDAHMVNADGSPKRGADGNPVVQTGISVDASGATQINGGIAVSFDSGSGYAVNDGFLFQPVKTAAASLTMATERADDLAFAAPVRGAANPSNLGDASVAGVTVTNTEIGTSAFDGSGGINVPSGAGAAAPVEIRFTSATDYEVLDSSGNTLTTATVNNADYSNLLGQAGYSSTYPGYDLSLSGRPAAGDGFSLEYNQNGINDNTNAVNLAKLQQSGLVKLSSNSASQTRSLHDAYSSLVGRVGEKSATADTSLEAAKAMQEQSQSWFDSVSGVSLDEEAANLIRYQQSYAAAARILSTAQDLFDTILAAAR